MILGSPESIKDLNIHLSIQPRYRPAMSQSFCCSSGSELIIFPFSRIKARPVWKFSRSAWPEAGRGGHSRQEGVAKAPLPSGESLRRARRPGQAKDGYYPTTVADILRGLLRHPRQCTGFAMHRNAGSSMRRIPEDLTCCVRRTKARSSTGGVSAGVLTQSTPT